MDAVERSEGHGQWILLFCETPSSGNQDRDPVFAELAGMKTVLNLN